MKKHPSNVCFANLNFYFNIYYNLKLTRYDAREIYYKHKRFGSRRALYPDDEDQSAHKTRREELPS